MSLHANSCPGVTFLGDFIKGLFLNWGRVTSSIFRRCKANSSWDCVRICATDTPGCGGEIHFKQVPAPLGLGKPRFTAWGLWGRPVCSILAIYSSVASAYRANKTSHCWLFKQS